MPNFKYNAQVGLYFVGLTCNPTPTERENCRKFFEFEKMVKNTKMARSYQG